MSQNNASVRVYMDGISGNAADVISALPSVTRVPEPHTADVWLVTAARDVARAAAQDAPMVLVVDEVDYLGEVCWCAPVAVSLSDSCGVLAGAIRAAHNGDCYISPSVAALLRRFPAPDEYDLLRTIFERPDLTLKQLATHLGVSARSARARLHNLYTLACAGTRAGLVVEALRKRWINPQDYALTSAPCAALAPRERDILQMIFRWPDISMADLCHALDVAEGTLRTWMRAMYSRAGVHSREALLIKALRRGWVSLDEVFLDGVMEKRGGTMT